MSTNRKTPICRLCCHSGRWLSVIIGGGWLLHQMCCSRRGFAPCCGWVGWVAGLNSRFSSWSRCGLYIRNRSLPTSVSFYQRIFVQDIAHILISHWKGNVKCKWVKAAWQPLYLVSSTDLFRTALRNRPNHVLCCCQVARQKATRLPVRETRHYCIWPWYLLRHCKLHG